MADEAALYKQRIVGLYERAASRYGQIGPPFAQIVGRRLVEWAELRPGERVLDVGCGRGAVLFPAAEVVGPSGRVLGIDLAEAMVRATATEIAQRGLTNAEVRRMDAEQLDLPDASFDAALCSFAVFFFPRLDDALNELHRVLRPGGSAGFSQARHVDARWDWENELFIRYAPSDPTPPAAREQDLRAPGALAACLTKAGFTSAREHREPIEVTWRDADEWWDALWTHGTRRPLELMSPDVRSRFEAEGRAHVATMAGQGPLTRRWELIVVLADC